MAFSSPSVDARISTDGKDGVDERKRNLFGSNAAKYFLSSINNSSISGANYSKCEKLYLRNTVVKKQKATSAFVSNMNSNPSATTFKQDSMIGHVERQSIKRFNRRIRSLTS